MNRIFLVWVVLMMALSTQAQATQPGEVWKEPKTGMEFVWMPEGCFLMGEEGKTKQKCVEGFWMGKYEVTQQQYQRVMDMNPSNFKGDNLPVEQVSWNDTQGFIEELKYLTGGSYHLPTEVQWEYACRAGGKHQLYCGNGFAGKLGWYEDNSDNKTHPVGQKRPNGWGLYDMSGNVWEWVEDWYDDDKDYKRLRGGSWSDSTEYLRAANRYIYFYEPADRVNSYGFRLTRSR